MLFPIDVSHLQSLMLIFLGVQTAVDVNHLLPSMLIFSLLVTGLKVKFEMKLQIQTKTICSFIILAKTNQLRLSHGRLSCISKSENQMSPCKQRLKTSRTKILQTEIQFYFQLTLQGIAIDANVGFSVGLVV
jgi:hypothetical protein